MYMNVKWYSTITPDNSGKILQKSNEGEEETQDTEKARERKDMFIKFQLKNWKKRDCL